MNTSQNDATNNGSNQSTPIKLIDFDTNKEKDQIPKPIPPPPIQTFRQFFILFFYLMLFMAFYFWFGVSDLCFCSFVVFFVRFWVYLCFFLEKKSTFDIFEPKNHDVLLQPTTVTVPHKVVKKIERLEPRYDPKMELLKSKKRRIQEKVCFFIVMVF